MRLGGTLASGALALAVVSCAKVPTEAADAARASLEAAVKAEGPIYAADVFAKADGLVKSMDADLGAQARKSRLQRSYKTATALAGQAADAARQAVDAAIKGKDQAKADVARLVPEVEKGLADADARIKAVEASRGIRLDANQLKAQLEAGRQSLEEARSEAAAAKVMDAKKKLLAISESLAAAASAVDAAMKASR